MEFKRHHNVTVEIVRATQKGEPVIVEVMGCSWSVTCTELTHSSNEWGPPRITLEPVAEVRNADKPAGGIKLKGPAHNRLPYGLTWKAAAKLVAWLHVEVAKHRAPVAPTVGQLIQQGYLKASDSPLWAGRCKVDLSPEALTAAVWNGEGLPPVGCVCACGPHANSSALLVVGFDELGPVGRWINGPDKGKYFSAGQYQLSPLRTAEQLAAEAREAAILAIAEIICKDGAFDLEDPEVKASATALYAAGCRLA